MISATAAGRAILIASVVLSRKVLWSIGLGIVGVLIITWHVGSLPARVVIINQSGNPLGNVVIDADGARYQLGNLGNGESRRISITPAEHVRVTFRTTADRSWNSPEPVTAGQSLLLYVTPGDRIVARNRIGTYNR